jgi:hypothetical protein
MKPYLLGQGVYFFVDCSFSYPLVYIACADMSMFILNLTNVLVMKAIKSIDYECYILSSLFTKVLHVVVDY